MTARPQPPSTPDAPGGGLATTLVASSFLVAGAAAGALLVLFVLGGQPQLEGLLLFLSLGGLGFGIVLWSQRLLPNDMTIERRHPPAATRRRLPARPAEEALGRRTFLVRLLGLAVAGVAAALAMPVFSLGPAPRAATSFSPWRQGRRLVGADGDPVTAQGLPVGSFATVFPEGEPGSAEGQTVLIHVERDLLNLPADRAAWAPQGFVAYSKVCTHAGCPVGLYLTGQHRLLCPCHQSTFDVLTGAMPVFGPAVRPLPQLPIQLLPDGTFAALGDFPEPIGPSYWNIHDA
jgi:ubiquinol-cytochrome c reductase iron-sulfur subunit